YEKPIDTTTPEEIKNEIMHNLHIVSWLVLNQHFFKLDEDPVILAHRFLEDSQND
ncbi:8943_t:CDS:2, partial [Scutellospora calospora]